MGNVVEVALYKGKVKVRFFPDTHVYIANGERPPSVTGIIGIIDKSRGLIPWAVGLCEEYLRPFVGQELSEEMILEAVQQHSRRKEEAANVGTAMHDWCEGYIKYKLNLPGHKEPPEMPDDPAVLIGVNGFLDWTKEHKVRFVSSERIVYSRKHHYIGQMDIEAMIDGGLCVVDLKSSSALYNSVRLQTAGYGAAATEETGKKYKGRWAVRLAKETEEEYVARMEKKRKTDYPSYLAFEAKFLDETKGAMEDDLDAFLAAKTLSSWNGRTDFYRLSRRAA